MERVGITIIGAGVIGLAVARELSVSFGEDIFVIEKNYSFGQETSSRNSEVIHAGIYYPSNSQKAKTCTQGRRLLYKFCEENNINHKRTGKLIVTIDHSETVDLENLFKKGIENGVEDLTLLDKDQIKKIEPNIKSSAAIYSPSTGVIDSHGFMKKLLLDFKSNAGEIAYNTKVIGIDKDSGGFKIYVEDKTGESFTFLSKFLINCAGLNSDKIAELTGIKLPEYKLKYCKGDYFRVSSGKSKFINRLIYPVPKERESGLGIHATLDLAASLRLGPDAEYVEAVDYTINETKRRFFYESTKPFLPFIEIEDLTTDTSGIRPKLQGENQDFRDFIIKEESDNNAAGLINLIGIESPGLTSSLSIAKIVKELITASAS
ncbi:MAG: NAD(P)/FAD-dependent oxidoreductase [Candidatus Omnitrophota bacterium]|nr:MAG: NAD(P)/FAD-dependent oxidoreductase [Candidatus Omnitrophota bacterium]